MSTAINAFSASAGVKLERNAQGAVAIADQTEGLVAGVTAGLTGLLNGGATTAVGLASTVVEGAKLLGTTALINKTDFTKEWPLVGVGE